ncbi:MAG: FAD:protein FMN transferase [Coriobacteriaceae bacterium]|nr:FAD:protein FMN transferase [Coriobacteriaceae bacterium]
MTHSRPITRRGMLALAGALLGAAPLATSGCARDRVERTKDRPATGSTFAFDTYCTFTVYGDDTAVGALTRACAHYDRLFDLYAPESDIARINAAGGASCPVDAATIELVKEGLDFSSRSNGLFDITIGAVSTLWDFHEGVRPDDAAIAQALACVDWRGVRVDERARTVTLENPHAKLDLGGIAKGFIADKLCLLLGEETDATGASISLGGNIAFFGSKPDGTPWSGGIRDANDPKADKVQGTVKVDAGSLVTSGLYERTFTQDGTTYWHILDPRTGMPVETDIAGVTVYCPSSTAADALSTTLFVAGSKEGRSLAERTKDTAALFILQDGSRVQSPDWQTLTNYRARESSRP